MCDDEGCSVGSKRIPRPDIAAILLGQAGLPRSAPAGSVVLSDGSVRPGHFDFLNLGYVTVDGQDLDRAGIAAIIFTEIAPPKRDVLITRDGTARLGRLTTCNPASCTFDSLVSGAPPPAAASAQPSGAAGSGGAPQVVPRDTTRWIGLGQEGHAPPAPPSQDTIVLAGKPPVAARATSIDGSTVGTTHGDFARKDVAWIYVADVPKPPPSGAYGAPSSENPQPPQPPPPPPPAPQPGNKPTPAPSPQPRAPAHGSNCKPGALWTGRMAAHAWGTVDQIRSDLYIDVDVKMQETICRALSVDGKSFGTVSVFDPTGSFIRNRMTENGPYLSCRGEGSGQADSSARGQAIYRNDRAGSTTAAWGFEVPKGSARYFVSIGAAREAKLVLQCHANGQDTTMENSLFGSPFPGRNPLHHDPFLEDPEPRYLDGGKMIGSSRAPAVGAFRQIAFSWAICPPDVQCSLPPIPDESAPTKTPPCQAPAVQRSLMDPIWNQRQARARQLKSDFDALRGAYQTMQDNLSAWRAAMPICAIEEIGEKVAESFLKTYSGEGGEVTELVGKMATGDLSYMTEGQTETALDAVGEIRKIIQGATGAGDPAAMEEQLADCKALPQNLRDAAKAFVDAYAEVKASMPNVQQEVNDIRSDDQQYWDQWQKYYQACLDYAECMGTSPADCQQPPAQPSGPIPGQQTTLPTGPPH